MTQLYPTGYNSQARLQQATRNPPARIVGPPDVGQDAGVWICTRKSARHRRCGRRHRAPGGAACARLRSGHRWRRFLSPNPLPTTNRQPARHSPRIECGCCLRYRSEMAGPPRWKPSRNVHLRAYAAGLELIRLNGDFARSGLSFASCSSVLWIIQPATPWAFASSNRTRALASSPRPE